VITNADSTPVNPWPNSGTVVNLLATAQAGFVFTGWDGDCAAAGTANACQLTMTQPFNVIAHFAPTSN
jgi:uncharacterized repeat protein (TIGR02543 family)